MMWLCIEAGGRSRLTRCDKTQDSQSYQTKVLTPNLGFLKTRGGHRGRTPITFMQDGASCHTSLSTIGFLRRNGVKVLPNWPANSPDLNPVEHCWAWLSKRLVGKSFRTEDELEAAIRAEWDQKPPELLRNLYASMYCRIMNVIAAKGAATRY